MIIASTLLATLIAVLSLITGNVTCVRKPGEPAKVTIPRLNLAGWILFPLIIVCILMTAGLNCRSANAAEKAQSDLLAELRSTKQEVQASHIHLLEVQEHAEATKERLEKNLERTRAEALDGLVRDLRLRSHKSASDCLVRLESLGMHAAVAMVEAGAAEVERCRALELGGAPPTREGDKAFEMSMQNALVIFEQAVTRIEKDWPGDDPATGAVKITALKDLLNGAQQTFSRVKALALDHGYDSGAANALARQLEATAMIASAAAQTSVEVRYARAVEGLAGSRNNPPVTREAGEDTGTGRGGQEDLE